MNLAPRIINILHVEDNVDHAYLFRMILEETWPEVELHHESDGLEAIKYLTDYELDQPDLIVLDLKLPGMSGLDILGAIKIHSDLRRIPVVVLTTSNSDQDRQDAYAQYANSYLIKPVDSAGFRKLVSELYYYWSQVNQSPPGHDALAG